MLVRFNENSLLPPVLSCHETVPGNGYAVRKGPFPDRLPGCGDAFLKLSQEVTLQIPLITLLSNNKRHEVDARGDDGIDGVIQSRKCKVDKFL